MQHARGRRESDRGFEVFAEGAVWTMPRPRVLPVASASRTAPAARAWSGVPCGRARDSSPPSASWYRTSTTANWVRVGADRAMDSAKTVCWSHTLGGAHRASPLALGDGSNSGARVRPRSGAFGRARATAASATITGATQGAPGTRTASTRRQTARGTRTWPLQRTLRRMSAHQIPPARSAATSQHTTLRPCRWASVASDGKDVPITQGARRRLCTAVRASCADREADCSWSGASTRRRSRRARQGAHADGDRAACSPARARQLPGTSRARA